MKVQALTDGFYGGARQRAGSVFDVKDGVKAKWFEPVDAKEAVPAKAGKSKAKKEDAVALSELQKEQPVQEREVI